MSPIIGFIIPFKPRVATKNWQLDNQLLSNTIRSILNQTDPNFLIYIVYSEPPLEIKDDPRIKYLKSPFPFLPYDEIPANENELKWHKDKNLMAKRFDKSKKIMWGCKYAKEEGCRYLMAVDADDLLSSNLVSFIQENNISEKVAGWFINKGYVVKNGSRWGIKNLNMHSFNGSTHIIRQNIVVIPDFTTGAYVDFSMFTAHGWTKYRIHDYFKEELLPLNFFGVMYVVHSGNISDIQNIYDSFSFRNIAKKIIRGKYLNRAIRTEFSFIG